MFLSYPCLCAGDVKVPLFKATSSPNGLACQVLGLTPKVLPARHRLHMQQKMCVHVMHGVPIRTE